MSDWKLILWSPLVKDLGLALVMPVYSLEMPSSVRLPIESFDHDL